MWSLASNGWCKSFQSSRRSPCAHKKTGWVCRHWQPIGPRSKRRGINIVTEFQYPAEGGDVAQIVQPMLDANPDILCWCTSYTPMVHAMTEYAFQQGYKGKILSCTLDNYELLVSKTSLEFMEGVVFQFPDFDDPALTEKAFFFNQPNAFYDEYINQFPGSWSAVSWEYAAILDIWHAAVQKAGTVNPASVLAAMKQLGHVTHAFRSR